MWAFTPTHDNLLRPETGDSIRAQQFGGTLTWTISDENPYPGRDMRNVLHQYQRGRRLFLDTDADAMLTVEHDMVLPPDAVRRLTEAKADVVYGVYLFRHGSPVLNAFRYENDRNVGMSLSNYPAELRRAQSRGWARVSGLGFGCTLIRRHVLERLDFRGDDQQACDLPFAIDCLRNNFLQIARFDVPCLHIDGDKILDSRGGGMETTLVTAQQRVRCAFGLLDEGEEYELPVELAKDLQRAGYVSIHEDAAIVDLDDLTVVELRELARQRNVAYSGLKKAELIEALREVD